MKFGTLWDFWRGGVLGYNLHGDGGNSEIIWDFGLGGCLGVYPKDNGVLEW